VKYLLHITDNHLFADATKAGYGGIVPYESLVRVLQQAFQHAPGNIDAVIVTGDISGDNSKLSYHHFLQLVSQYIHVPVYVIPGNHDDNAYFDTQLTAYHLRAGEPLQLENWRIHGIDTRYQGTRGQVNAQQLSAIAKDIHSHSTAFNLLAMHHHVLSSKSWMDKHELINAGEFIDWLMQTPNINGIVHGHVHAPLQGYVDAKKRIPVFAGPSSCWQWEMTESFSLSHDKPGYQFITLHDNGRITCDVRRIETL